MYDRHKNAPSGSRGIPKPEHWEDLYDCFSQIEDVEPRELLDGTNKKGLNNEPNHEEVLSSDESDGN